MQTINYNNQDLNLTIAIIALTTGLPLQHILLYQLSFWHIPEIIRIIIFIAIEGPIMIYAAIVLINDIINRRLEKVSLLIISGLIILILWIISYVTLHLNEQVLIKYNRLNIQWVLMHGYYFLTGYLLAKYAESLYKYKQFFVVVWIIMLAQIVLFFDFSTITIDLKEPKSNNSIHLFLGTSFAIWSIITISLIKDNIRIAIYIVGALGLFLLGSRTAFYCFLAIFPIILFTAVPRMRIYLIIFSFLSILALVIAFPYIEKHRMFAIFTGTDLSLNFRKEIFKENIPDLISNWLWGNYGRFHRHYFPADTYMHNILSYWNQFGLIPFLILISSLIIVISRIRYYLVRINEPISFAQVSLIIYLVVAMIAAKSHNFSGLYFMFGIFAGIHLIPRNSLNTRTVNVR